MPVYVAFALVGICICWQAGGAGDDSAWLPALAALFLVAVHRPVRFKKAVPGLRMLVLPVLVLTLGAAGGSVLVQTVGWIWGWIRWTRATVETASVPIGRSWWGFLFLFPWITVDFPQIGWWFRLSGATVAAPVFEWLGFPVVREGTRLIVGGLPMSVEPACAGMGLLQSLLVVGVILLLLFFPTGRQFYLLLPALPVVAWLANVARILVITAAGLSGGVEFSQGLFHTWGGLLVIVLMLATALPLLWLVSRIWPDPSRR